MISLVSLKNSVLTFFQSPFFQVFFAKILVGAAQGIYSGMLLIVPVVDLAVPGGYVQGFHCMRYYLGYDFLIGHSANTGRRLATLRYYCVAF